MEPITIQEFLQRAQVDTALAAQFAALVQEHEKNLKNLAATRGWELTPHAPVPLSDDETEQATGGAVGANYWDLLNRPTTSVSTPESEHPTFPQKPPAVLR